MTVFVSIILSKVQMWLFSCPYYYQSTNMGVLPQYCQKCKYGCFHVHTIVKSANMAVFVSIILSKVLIRLFSCPYYYQKYKYGCFHFNTIVRSANRSVFHLIYGCILSTLVYQFASVAPWQHCNVYSSTHTSPK